MIYRLMAGEALECLAGIPDGSVDCCLTSPPYWGSRNRSYGPGIGLGTESDPSGYLRTLVGIFAGVRRVLKPMGTFWLNIGDSYLHRQPLGLPWRLARALQRDGWRLRQEIIWAKANPLPEPVKDRFVRSHESVFLFTKSERYFWDFEATRERGVTTSAGTDQQDTRETHGAGGGNYGLNAAKARMRAQLKAQGFVTRTRRDVWTIPTQAGQGGHFAIMPEALAERCILAGCSPNGTVLDPFMGSGTTGAVALRHGRSFIGIDLNPEYLALAQRRLLQIPNLVPLFPAEATA
jgi:DNA modification methylase